MIKIAINGQIGSGKDTVFELLSNKFKNDKSNNHIFSDVQNFKFADSLKDTICSWLSVTREQLEDREFKEKPLGDEWVYYTSEDINSKYHNKLLSQYDYDVLTKTLSPIVLSEMSLIKKIHTPRSLLQLLGTEAGRNIIHPDIWVNITKNKINNSSAHVIIVTDLRFENEFRYCKKDNFFIIRIKRPLEQRINFNLKLIEEFKNVNDSITTEQKILNFLKNSNKSLYNILTHESEWALKNIHDNCFDFIIDNSKNLNYLEEQISKIYKHIINSKNI